MRRMIAVFGLVCAVLSMAGAGYVLLNFGKVSAGYAVVPMVLALACLAGVKRTDKDE